MQAAMSGELVDLQVESTTGNGSVVAIPPSFNRHTVIVQGSLAPSAGAVQVEEADIALDSGEPFGGSWAPVGSPIAASTAASGQVTYHFTGLYKFIRARISTDIEDGYVDVRYMGAP